jgi:hypothetical protein
MFNALRCVPVVVCGAAEEEVLDAMRVAATFVPGLYQSTRAKLEMALLPFPSKPSEPSRRVTFDDIDRYAVVGCHTSSILDA